ncbi:hypothetical protein ILUMI_09438, partial [Ignelater luminosus]
MSGSKKIYVVDRKVQNELQKAITSKNRSIHRSLKWILILAQCFGQIPVQGIASPDARYLREMPNALEKVYFFLSFGLLILRTICVSIYGAWIYDESKEPLAILNSVSSETYNIEWVLFVAQCFAQMPVMGITEPDARYLKFTWKSWRVLYCVLNILGSGFLCVFYVYLAAVHGSDIYKASDIIFNLSTTTVTVLFLRLAMEWPELMRKWSAVESSMHKYGWPKYLHTRITIMSITVLGLAA